MGSNGYRVGVVGATGAVGSTMLELLAERAFPAREVIAFTSERSAGRKVTCGDLELECRTLAEESIQGLDLVLS
jgi:aspartate-semialdehyde dehydrogenase